MAEDEDRSRSLDFTLGSLIALNIGIFQSNKHFCPQQIQTLHQIVLTARQKQMSFDALKKKPTGA